MLILKKKDIIQHVDLNEDLIPIIEEAFISLSKGKTVMPPIMRIDIEKFHFYYPLQLTLRILI